MIEALTEPLSILAIVVGGTMIALMFIADWQNNKKPPKSRNKRRGGDLLRELAYYPSKRLSTTAERLPIQSVYQYTQARKETRTAASPSYTLIGPSYKLICSTTVTHAIAGVSLRRLYNSFESTSCNICLSRLKSTTNCFSFLFSSSSCFRRRSSGTPRPRTSCAKCRTSHRKCPVSGIPPPRGCRSRPGAGQKQSALR